MDLDCFDVSNSVTGASDLSSVLNSMTDLKAESLSSGIMCEEDDLKNALTSLESLDGDGVCSGPEAVECLSDMQNSADPFEMPSFFKKSLFTMYGPFPQFESQSTSETDVINDSAIPGVCGLRNLGNTCFMNAGLQCLLNNKTFHHYFGELNTEAFPAETLNSKFADIVKKAWSGSYSTLNLVEFKECFGNMYAQFKNFRQHDCQEFLALLLDKMHEELNISNVGKLKNKLEVSLSSINNTKDFTNQAVSNKSHIECNSDKFLKNCNIQTARAADSSNTLTSSDSCIAEPKEACEVSNNSNLFKQNQCTEKNENIESNATIYEKNTEKMADLLINNSKIDMILSKNELDASTDNSSCKHVNKRNLQSMNQGNFEKNEIAFKLNAAQKIPSIEDFVKDTKVLNTNVLVSDETNNLFKFDSEKFPKHDTSRLQETVDNLGHMVDLGTKQGGIKRVKITNLIHEKHRNLEQGSDPFSSALSKRLKIENTELSLEPLVADQEDIDECSESSSQSSELFALNSECRDLLVAEEIRRAYTDWDHYKALNQSVIVDTFHGQFRSSVVCSQCSHNSITYEPFMYLPVFLPHALERQIVVTYVQNDGSSPVHYLLNVNKYDRINKIREALQNLLDVAPEEVILAEVFDHHISRYLDENQSIQRVNDQTRSVYAFEVGKMYEENTDPSKSTNSYFQSDTKLNSSDTQGSLSVHNSPSDSIDIDEPSNLVSSSIDTKEIDLNFEEMETFSEQHHICAICLEELPDSKLSLHPNCDCILCHTCIEVSCKHYGSSTFTCPVCSSSVSPEEDFVPLHKIGDYNIRVSTISVPIVIRHDVFQEGQLKKTLIGHPSLLKLPSTISASRLYAYVDHAIPFLSTYSLLLVSSQGLSCSRCMYNKHCPGCEISRSGDIKLQAGESIAVRYMDLSPESVASACLVSEHKSMQQTRHKTQLDIYDCLEYFSERESLDEDSPWFCPICRRNQQATKSLSIWKFPDVLIIYLKRFVFHDFMSIKVEDKVTYPLEGLNLSNFSSGPFSGGDLIYDLQSCVCHFGGVSAGHYTSYSKHALTNEWYYYNDEDVKKEAPNTDDCVNEYIFFYQRR